MARKRTRGHYLNLTDLCEMIAWYLDGALVKDLAAAYNYPKQHISRLMKQHKVPMRRPTYGSTRYGYNKTTQLRVVENRTPRIHRHRVPDLPNHSRANATPPLASRESIVSPFQHGSS